MKTTTMKRNSNTFITFTVVLSLLLSFTLFTCKSASQPTLKETLVEVTSHNGYDGYMFLEYEGDNRFSLTMSSYDITIKDEFVSKYDVFDDTTTLYLYGTFDDKIERLVPSPYYGVVRTDKGVVIFTSDEKIDGNELKETLHLIKKSL